MILTEEVKKAIIDEFEQWKHITYGDLTDKQRKVSGEKFRFWRFKC